MSDMEVQNVELTIEDILSIHRHWITKLYVEDHRTEAEIVDLLYERRLPVTISQIQRCLRDWNLRPTSPSACSSSDTSTSTTPSTASSADWQVIRASSVSSSASTSPQNAELYSKRPLPSLPSTKPPSKIRNGKPTRQVNDDQGHVPRKRDFLKVTCHSRPARPYEVEMTLGVVVSKGPSPLQIYALDQQSHERLAVGLDRVPSLRKHEVRTEGRVGKRVGRKVRIVQDEGEDGMGIEE